MSMFRTYLLTSEKVGQIFSVGKKPLRVIAFKHFAVVWESKGTPQSYARSAGAGE